MVDGFHFPNVEHIDDGFGLGVVLGGIPQAPQIPLVSLGDSVPTRHPMRLPSGLPDVARRIYALSVRPSVIG